MMLLVLSASFRTAITNVACCAGSVLVAVTVIGSAVAGSKAGMVTFAFVESDWTTDR